MKNLNFEKKNILITKPILWVFPLSSPFNFMLNKRMAQLLKYLVFLFFLFDFSLMVAQDPQFTQFYSNPLYLSASLTGATQQHRIASTYRNQWSQIPHGFNTYSFSYDHFFSQFNSGVGAIITRDVAGTGKLGSTSLALLYSYDILVNPIWHVRPGLKFSYLNTSLNFYDLTFTSPTESAPSEFVGDFDGGISCMVYSPRFWAGIDVDHLLTPTQSLYADEANVPMKYSLFGGYQIIRKGRLLMPVDETVSLAFLYKRQGLQNQLDMGLYWFRMPMVLGLWYRGIPLVNSPRGDSMAALVGFKTKYISIGYSYDFTISHLISSTGGAHEISLVYQFTTAPRGKKPHAIPCPEF